jgi:hypothetical protein
MRPLAVLLLLSSLVACSPFVKDGQPGTASTEVILQAGQTVGQTLLARDSGLQGIEIFLGPETAGTGEIHLRLRADTQSSTDLAVSTLAVQSITAPGWYRFTFPPPNDSRGKDYYLLLELQGDGRVRVGTAPGDTYLDGALYQNESPLDAQMTFRLVYEPGQLFLGLLAQAGIWLGILGAAIFLFILPGWALLALLWPGWDALSWGERLGLAGGMSLALYPLLFLWTDIIGLHLGPLYAWLPPLVGLGIILWRYVAGWKVRRLQVAGRRLQVASRRSEVISRLLHPVLHITFHDLTLLLILALLFLTRFWVIRSLDVPMWGDSVQHTVMAQLMLDNGGLFKSWEPYAPYGSLTVQFGFPAFAALFAWLTGLGSVKAALIVGQIVNGLAVLALYPLAVRIANGNRWAGVGAVLVAGLLSPMPAFYVNWGRYAQLAGQAVLPVALWMVWEALTPTPSPSPVRKSAEQERGVAIGLSALALAGMMLTYYRMPFYYATFVLALLVGWGLPGWRLNWRVWAGKLGILLAVAVLAGLLFLPWGLRLVGSNLAGAVEAGVTSGSSVEAVLADYRAWRDLFAYVSESLVVVALAGLAWSLVRKRWMVAAQGLWVALLSAVIAGGLIHLPGANMMQTFAILIALYIPIGLVVGWMIAEIAGPGSGRIRQSLVAVAVFVAAVLGALGQRNIAIPATFAYVTRPDTRAMAWIREHLPGEARFLVEGYGIYGGTTIVGGDAGWWMPLLTHRQNTMPPQYAIWNEAPIQPDYTQRMVALVKKLETISLDSPEGVDLLCGEGVTHVYIGQGQGEVGFGVTQLFSPDELLDSQDYSLLYHQDRVYVFALKAGICP